MPSHLCQEIQRSFCGLVSILRVVAASPAQYGFLAIGCSPHLNWLMVKVTGLVTPCKGNWIGLDETLTHLPEYRWLERQIAPERVVLRLSNLSHKLEAVKAGHGIAPLFCFLAEPEPQLIRLTEPEPLFDTVIWLLSHPNLRQVARVRAFMEFISQCAKAEPLLQGGLLKPIGSKKSAAQP